MYVFLVAEKNFKHCHALRGPLLCKLAKSALRNFHFSYKSQQIIVGPCHCEEMVPSIKCVYLCMYCMCVFVCGWGKPALKREPLLLRVLNISHSQNLSGLQVQTADLYC